MGEWTDVSPGLAVPTEYAIDVDDPGLPCLISLEIRMVGRAATCRSFTLTQREGGTPVRAEDVRQIPLAGIVRHSVEWVVFTLEASGSSWRRAPATTQEQINAAYSATARQKPYTEERIREAASLFNKAVANGEPPTRYLAEHLLASRSTVARLIRAARERGLLEAR